MGLFGKTEKKDPKEMVKEWRSKLRKEQRTIDRQVRGIQREEDKVKRSLKDAAKKGQNDVCRILAKEVVQSRRAVSKMYASKAQINSVMMSMQNQLATVRLSGSLQKSTDVMKSMNNLMKVSEIRETMMELSKEMMKAGIMEEMMEDTFESALDEEGLDEAADTEIEKILFEVTSGILGKATDAPMAHPAGEEAAAAAVSEASSEEEEEEEMQRRLQALRT